MLRVLKGKMAKPADPENQDLVAWFDLNRNINLSSRSRALRADLRRPLNGTVARHTSIGCDSSHLGGNALRLNIQLQY
jgi:hypothetical protein